MLVLVFLLLASIATTANSHRLATHPKRSVSVITVTEYPSSASSITAGPTASSSLGSSSESGAIGDDDDTASDDDGGSASDGQDDTYSETPSFLIVFGSSTQTFTPVFVPYPTTTLSP